VFSIVKYKFFRILHDLSEESALYVIGVLLIGVISIISLISPNFIPKDLLYFPLTHFVWGFLVFIYQATAKVRGSTVARLLLSVITVVLSTLSYGAAKQVLNIGFEAPASAFPITHSVISILAMPAVAIIAVSGIGFILILAMPLFFLPIEFSSLKAKSLLKLEVRLKPFEEKIFIKAIFRYISLIFLVSVCFDIAGKINGYSERVDWYAKRFAYHFEAEQFSYCDLKEGEKVSYLNGDLIVVVNYEEEEDNYFFRVRNCVSTLP
jgi:hypothetical protein